MYHVFLFFQLVQLSHNFLGSKNISNNVPFSKLITQKPCLNDIQNQTIAMESCHQIACSDHYKRIVGCINNEKYSSDFMFFEDQKVLMKNMDFHLDEANKELHNALECIETDGMRDEDFIDMMLAPEQFKEHEDGNRAMDVDADAKYSLFSKLLNVKQELENPFQKQNVEWVRINDVLVHKEF